MYKDVEIHDSEQVCSNKHTPVMMLSSIYFRSYFCEWISLYLR